ncbi:MAG: hypothetical protein ABIM99_00775 [Candidatus Dojkabacteria bacterium]
MFKRLKLKRRLFILSVPIFLIISGVALYTNQIFFFSEFKPLVEIRYNLEDSGKLKELLDRTSQLNNVASVDRINNIIQIQGRSYDDVKTNIQDLTKDYTGVIFTVKEISSENKGALTALLGGLYVLLLAGAAIHFYFISSKGGELKIIIGSYVVLFVNFTLSLLLSLGLLSLVSRYYKVESLELLLILISSILTYLLFYSASEGIQDIKNFQELGQKYKLYISKVYRSIIVIVFILLVVVSIGLGTGFVIHALALFAFILIAIYQSYWNSYLMEDWHNLQNSFRTKISTIRNSRKKPKNAAPKVSVESKKKDKKKKKKK